MSLHYLEISGTAQARGLAHGEHFRKEIHELAAIRRELVAGYLKQLRSQQITALALRMVAALKNYPDSFAEFDGIAQGSSLGHAELMILNNYTDMRDFVSFSDDDNGGCSSLSVRAPSGGHICGQTWDMHASARPYVLHLKMHGEENVHVLTVTGCMGLAGVNRQTGVTVFINNLHSRDNKIAIMWPALVRELLRQPTAPAALEYLGRHLPCSGRNYLICDKDISLNVETTASRFVVSARLKGPGAIFHTNHYVSELKNSEMAERLSKTTLPRYAALQEYFSHGENLEKDMSALGSEVLGGEITKPVCVERPSEKHGAMTCGGLILDCGARRGSSFAGLWRENERRSFSW